MANTAYLAKKTGSKKTTKKPAKPAAKKATTKKTSAPKPVKMAKLNMADYANTLARPDYDNVYQTALNQGTAAYEAQVKGMNDARAAEQQGLDTRLAANKETLAQNLDTALRESSLQSQAEARALPQNLARLGIRGGGSETAAANLAGTYQNARGAATQSRDRSLADLMTQYGTNAADMAARYAERGGNLAAQRYADAQNLAQWKYGADTDAFMDERNHNRQNMESDRAYNRNVFSDDRAYNRNVFTDDRAYNRQNMENDRAYNFQREQWDFNRDQALAAQAQQQAAQSAAASGGGGGRSFGGGAYSSQKTNGTAGSAGKRETGYPTAAVNPAYARTGGQASYATWAKAKKAGWA